MSQKGCFIARSTRSPKKLHVSGVTTPGIASPALIVDHATSSAQLARWIGLRTPQPVLAGWLERSPAPLPCTEPAAVPLAAVGPATARPLSFLSVLITVL